MKKFNIIVIFLLSFILVGCENNADEVSLETTPVIETSVAETDKGAEKIYVYLHGQVKKPGVYTVDVDSRLFSVIELAGGFKKNAQKDSLNLAEPLQDGQSIYVMSKKEYRNLQKEGSSRLYTSGDSSADNTSGKVSMNTANDISGKVDINNAGKVNINIATVQELMELSGIGKTKAEAIIEYREKNGKFTDIAEIKNVSGIGNATFSNIEGMITVK